MAAGPFLFADKSKLNFFSATNLLAATAANFRMALVGSGWTPAPSTDEVFADVTNELPTGGGYTAGGAACPSVALTQTAGVVKFTCAPIVWTATGGGIPAWRRMVMYYLGTLNGKVNPLVGNALGDSTPADIPATSAGNTLTITPNANGILSAT